MKPNMRAFIRHAWAIDLGYPENASCPLAGFYYFSTVPPKPFQSGLMTATFHTRAMARKFCKEAFSGEGRIFRPRVVKIHITIKETK